MYSQDVLDQYADHGLQFLSKVVACKEGAKRQRDHVLTEATVMARMSFRKSLKLSSHSCL